MSREGGFTLVELLVAMVIGMVVLLAGLQALDSFTKASATVTSRTDNTQRARLNMDLLIRGLRSQVCRGPNAPSMMAASPTSISFVADLSDGSALPERHDVTYDATKRRLSELRFKVKSRDPVSGALDFAPAGGGGFSLSDVGPVAPTPIFRFWAYDTQTPPRPEALFPPVPLSSADLARVARITVTFRVGPAGASGNASSSASLEDEVFLRSVDPSDLAPRPRCA